MTEFIARLKQHKLVQWALAYVAFAFALLQGMDVVAHQFGWPDGLQRGVTLALVVDFLVVVVLAWYHGERGAQKMDSGFRLRRARNDELGEMAERLNLSPASSNASCCRTQTETAP